MVKNIKKKRSCLFTRNENNTFAKMKNVQVEDLLFGGNRNIVKYSQK